MQLLLNILVSTCAVVLTSVGFALVFSTTRFFHFAHAAVYTAGAYAAFACARWGGVPPVAAAFISLVLSILLGCLMEWAIYRPLRQRAASSLVLLIASLGLYIALQNVISLVFGDESRSLQSHAVTVGYDLLGARITGTSLLMIVVSVILVTAVMLVLRWTGLGRAMRAVANDGELARIHGLKTDQVILATFAIGSGLAGMAGILIALDTSMSPTMGVNALMMAIVAVVIGGVSSIPGVLMGSLLLATTQQLAIWTLGSQWKDAVAFAVLLLFLLLRPQGILGKRVRKATI